MILVRELAAECDVAINDVLAALVDMNEFTLGPDSSVRDAVAETLRRRFREHRPSAVARQKTSQLNSDEELQRLRERLSGTSDQRAGPTIDLNVPLSRKPARKGRSWRPGDEPLNKVTRALADQIVRYSSVEHRQPGVIFPDELAEARERRMRWARECIEVGPLLHDDEIAAWIAAFPNVVLQPREILYLAGKGLTPTGAQLRLWYGRVNNGRLTLFDQIRRQDISIEQAVRSVAEYERKHSG